MCSKRHTTDVSNLMQKMRELQNGIMSLEVLLWIYTYDFRSENLLLGNMDFR